MCRLAQGSVSENLEQSIASHLGTGKRMSRLMFASSGRGGGDQQSPKKMVLGLMLVVLRNRFGPHPGKRSTDA